MRMVGGELDRAKPDPLPYLRGCGSLARDAARSVAFEDSLVRRALGGAAPVSRWSDCRRAVGAAALVGAGATFVVADFTDPRIVSLIEARRRGASPGGEPMRLAQIVDEAASARSSSARAAKAGSSRARARRWNWRAGDRSRHALRKLIADRGVGKPVDLAAALKEKRVLCPIDHKDPAHMFVTGTGLTHLGSPRGATRCTETSPARRRSPIPCSMFRLGLEGGKPAPARRACSRSGSTRATAGGWSRRAAIS